jgi:hypothetical protein
LLAQGRTVAETARTLSMTAQRRPRLARALAGGRARWISRSLPSRSADQTG